MIYLESQFKLILILMSNYQTCTFGPFSLTKQQIHLEIQCQKLLAQQKVTPDGLSVTSRLKNTSFSWAFIKKLKPDSLPLGQKQVWQIAYKLFRLIVLGLQFRGLRGKINLDKLYNKNRQFFFCLTACQDNQYKKVLLKQVHISQTILAPQQIQALKSQKNIESQVSQIFCMGLLLLQLLVGTRKLINQRGIDIQIFEQAIRDIYGSYSKKLKMVIIQCLAINPTKRISLKDLSHIFTQQSIDPSLSIQQVQPLPADQPPEPLSFEVMNQWKQEEELMMTDYKQQRLSESFANQIKEFSFGQIESRNKVLEIPIQELPNINIGSDACHKYIDLLQRSVGKVFISSESSSKADFFTLIQPQRSSGKFQPLLNNSNPKLQLISSVQLFITSLQKLFQTHVKFKEPYPWPQSAPFIHLRLPLNSHSQLSQIFNSTYYIATQFTQQEKYIGLVDAKTKQPRKGVYFWTDQDYYAGQFIQGKQQGFGCLYWKQGRHLGFWFNGEKEGPGVQWKDGQKWVGQWKKGKLLLQRAVEKLVYQTGQVYQGQTMLGQRHGKGKYTAKDTIMQGLFQCDQFIKGTVRFKNGDVYKGQFKDRKRHGFGEYSYKNGEKYVGSWSSGKKHGKGIQNGIEVWYQQGLKQSES